MKKPGRPRKYPIDTLPVGGFVFLPHGNAAAMHSSVDKYERKTGKEFTCQQHPSGFFVKRLK